MLKTRLKVWCGLGDRPGDVSTNKKCSREIIFDNSQAKGNETNPCMYISDLPYAHL